LILVSNWCYKVKFHQEEKTLNLKFVQFSQVIVLYILKLGREKLADKEI